MMQSEALSALSVGGILGFQTSLTAKKEAEMRQPKHLVTGEEDL